MTINDLLYKLDSIHNSGALDREVREAAKHAYQFIIAFKCARYLDGAVPVAALKDEAWGCDARLMTVHVSPDQTSRAV